MYKKIKIENFRGISNLELNDLQQFNLLMGKNNCGKTSLLESIFLISNGNKPFSSVWLNNLRGHYITQPYSWTVLFNKMNIESPIRLTGEILKPKEKRTLMIKILSEKNVELPNGELFDLSQKGIGREFLDNRTGLSINFSISKNRGKKQTYESKIWLGKENKLENESQGNYTETLKSSFITTASRPNIAAWFTEILIKKQDEKITNILKTVEPRLENLSLGADNILYCDLGFPKRLPFSTAGEGLNKVLAIILAIHATSNGVVLIDEIENGLHYSIQEILWQAIFEAASTFDVQVFASTHSYENIKAFSASYEKLESQDDKLRLFRIENEKDNQRVIDFNHQEIDMALEKGWEVR